MQHNFSFEIAVFLVVWKIWIEHFMFLNSFFNGNFLQRRNACISMPKAQIQKNRRKEKEKNLTRACTQLPSLPCFNSLAAPLRKGSRRRAQHLPPGDTLAAGYACTPTKSAQSASPLHEDGCVCNNSAAFDTSANHISQLNLLCTITVLMKLFWCGNETGQEEQTRK